MSGVMYCEKQKNKKGRGPSAQPCKMLTRVRPSLITIIEVRGFIGFANFYRIFIRNFGDIARPLYNVTKKDIAF
jgi:hypothetical protein